MVKASNRESRLLVEERKPFKANNLFAEEIRGLYAVYSYGYHFPLFVFKDGVWYENTDKYSVTTSKHKSQARPRFYNILQADTRSLKQMINNH